jgi:DNA polymerase-3 subunit alpha
VRDHRAGPSSWKGLARNVGKHAGGVVIAPSTLTDFAPLYSG